MTAKAAFGPVLERALHHALHHLDDAANRPVCASTDLAQLRFRFDRPLPEDGIDPAQVIDELVRDAEGGIIGSAGGRFFGWVIGGSLPAPLAAHLLASALGQKAALHALGPP